MFNPTAADRPSHSAWTDFAATASHGVHGEERHARRSVDETLKLLCDTLSPQRRVVHAGDLIYQAGERFEHLYILNSGFFKIVTLAADGREQVVGLKFRGDWLGFDGIAQGRYTCDAVAMDTGERHGHSLRRAARRLRSPARRC